MAEQKKIRTKKGLLKELGIKSFDEIAADPQVKQRIHGVVSRIAPDLLRKLINTVPELRKAVIGLCDTVAKVAKNLSDVQRERWGVIGEAARNDKFTSEQVMELSRLVTETERAEGKNWSEVIKTVVKVAGVMALVVFGVTAWLFGRSQRA